MGKSVVMQYIHDKSIAKSEKITKVAYPFLVESRNGTGGFGDRSCMRHNNSNQFLIRKNN